MNERTVFVSDSGIDYPKGALFPYELKTIPLRVYIDEKEYNDKVDIDTEEIYKALIEGKKVATSMPNPEISEKVFRDCAKNYDRVIAITISSKLSNTNENFQLIVEKLKEEGIRNIEVLDSKTASIKQYYVILRAMEHLKKTGKLTQSDINNFVEEGKLYFYLPTLEYLERGGRIGKAKALLGKLLSIKPILTTDTEGEVSAVISVRTLEKGIETLQNMISDFSKDNNEFIVVAGFISEISKKNVSRVVEPFLANSSGFVKIGPAIGVHVGPDVFGILVGKKGE